MAAERRRANDAQTSRLAGRASASSPRCTRRATSGSPSSCRGRKGARSPSCSSPSRGTPRRPAHGRPRTSGALPPAASLRLCNVRGSTDVAKSNREHKNGNNLSSLSGSTYHYPSYQQTTSTDNRQHQQPTRDNTLTTTTTQGERNERSSEQRATRYLPRRRHARWGTCRA